MKTKVPTTKDILLERLENFCQGHKLTFDEPGSINFRKVKNVDQYTIYFRSPKGQKMFEDCWLRKDSTRLSDSLQNYGLELHKVSGGCADCSIATHIGLLQVKYN